MLFLRYLLKGVFYTFISITVYTLVGLFIGWPWLFWDHPAILLYNALTMGVVFGAGMYYIDRIM
jgi:hypothetical protein